MKKKKKLNNWWLLSIIKWGIVETWPYLGHWSLGSLCRPELPRMELRMMALFELLSAEENVMP
jgi:hypothetical protein